MRHRVHDRLCKLARSHNGEYGKLVQKLLAIAFCEAGVLHLVERSVQGIDLEVRLPDGEEIALEVKTTQGNTVRFKEKDLEGLDNQIKSNKTPYIAVLGSALIDEWIIMRYPRGEIQPESNYLLEQLALYRDTKIEELIKDTFNEAVICHTPLFDGPQARLDTILRQYSCVAIP